jgi:RNA polymerase sigma-70 factor (ECF subfamily)
MTRRNADTLSRLPTVLTDGELVRQIAAGGDHNAETELFRRMAPRVRLYGLRHLRDEHAADDLAQQVLLITLDAIREGRLREPDKLTSFMLGTCRLTVLDLKRNTQRREQLLQKYGEHLLAPTASAMPKVDHDALKGCVQRLQERERTVVVMTFFDDQTCENISEFLGVSDANVRVIRHRAIHQLRDCMGVAS